MHAPAPPNWHAHLTDLGFRTPASPGQGLPFSELLQGPVGLSVILVYKVGIIARETSDGKKELLHSSL